MSDIPKLEQRLRGFAAADDEGLNWEDVQRRAEGLPPTRRFSRKQLVFVLAATLLAAASVVGVLVSRETGTGAIGGRCLVASACGPRIGPSGTTGPQGTMGPGPSPTLAHPLGLPGAEQVSLSDAVSALGGRLVLPDTPQASPTDVGTVWLSGPNLGPTLGNSRAVAAVTFPAAGVWVNYQQSDLYTDDVLLEYQAGARQDPSTFHVIDLNGVPALASVQGPDQTSYGIVEFEAAGVGVTIFGHDATTLRAIAQSIVDRSDAPPDGQLGRVDGTQLFPYFPPARQIDLADASATLGAPVVLPDTPLAKASDVGPVWAERTCPAPNGRITDLTLLHVCWIWVSFPLSGLSVGYLRPAMYYGTKNEWELQARFYGDNAKVIELGSVPALAIEPQDPYPGSVEFDLNGTRVVVAGAYDTATLQAVAQSIVDGANG